MSEQDQLSEEIGRNVQTNLMIGLKTAEVAAQHAMRRNQDKNFDQALKAKEIADRDHPKSLENAKKKKKTPKKLSYNARKVKIQKTKGVGI